MNHHHLPDFVNNASQIFSNVFLPLLYSPKQPPLPLQHLHLPHRSILVAICFHTLIPPTSIRRFLTVPPPQFKLQQAWGHSLPIIDPKCTFKILLQNPNCLNLYYHNYSLQYEFKTCCDYGSAVLCLPETNVNWNLSHQ